MAGDLNGHVGKTSGGFEGVHGGNGYGDRNRKGERKLEFGLAMDMLVANTVFKKRKATWLHKKIMNLELQRLKWIICWSGKETESF